SCAIELAKATGAELYAAYVISNVSMYAGIRDISWAESMNEHFAREGEEANKEVSEKGKTADVEVKSFILEGNPGEEIVDFAKANDIDMIVMGTRGQTGLSRFLLGSVAERVVRHSKVQVLVVP
ncbi:MAG: universal stress protein, partial [Methanosarcinaceae archaeon]